MLVLIADMRSKLVILTVALVVALSLGACTLLFLATEPQNGIISKKYINIKTTTYCACGICCDWKYNLVRQPVHSKGRHAGKPKAVGITASGTKAKPGTLAADTRYYPFGTVFYIPGYGYGVVEDRGGDIKGRHRLDLYHNTHQEARRWGRKKVQAVVFPHGTPVVPKNAPPPR